MRLNLFCAQHTAGVTQCFTFGDLVEKKAHESYTGGQNNWVQDPDGMPVR